MSDERPAWATPMALFCLATLAYIIPRDLFLPHAREVEVWAGFELRGFWAQATAPLHWAIFAAGAWGFYKLRSWIWPWASLYAFYVAGSHLVWNLTSPHGEGWLAGLGQLVVFSVPGVLLWRARPPAGV